MGTFGPPRLQSPTQRTANGTFVSTQSQSQQRVSRLNKNPETPHEYDGPADDQLNKTGGAGNKPWYNNSQRASQRPASAAVSQRSQRPSATQQQPQQQYAAQEQSQLLSARPVSSAGYPSSSTRSYDQTQPYNNFNEPSSSTSAAPSSRRDLSSIPTAEEHAEDCICTVCTCGHHVCPPTPRVNHYDPNIQSENHAAYTGRFVPAERVARPDQYKPHNAKFEDETTNRRDFRNFGVLPRKVLPRSRMMDTGVGRSSVPFDDTTTHKSDFQAHPFSKRESTKDSYGKFDLGPDDRDFGTTHRNDFVPHPLQQRRARPNEGSTTSLPFQGSTTHRTDFQHFVGHRPSIPVFHSHGFQSNPEDRGFLTENREQYTPKAGEPCPAIPVATACKLRPGHIQVELNPQTQRYVRKPYYYQPRQ